MFSAVDRPRRWFSRSSTSNSTWFRVHGVARDKSQERMRSGQENVTPGFHARIVIRPPRIRLSPSPSLRVRVCTLSLTPYRRLCLSTSRTRVHGRIYSRRQHYSENYDGFQDVTMSASSAEASRCQRDADENASARQRTSDAKWKGRERQLTITPTCSSVN